MKRVIKPGVLTALVPHCLLLPEFFTLVTIFTFHDLYIWIEHEVIFTHYVKNLPL